MGQGLGVEATGGDGRVELGVLCVTAHGMLLQIVTESGYLAFTLAFTKLVLRWGT